MSRPGAKSGDSAGPNRPLASNRLLAILGTEDRSLIEPYLESVTLYQGEVLYEPGDDVSRTYFPGLGTLISLLVPMQNGRAAEAATIGREGALGGIVSAGHKPAFARAVVQTAGPALRLSTARLEEAKLRSQSLRELFSRYADALLAQILQSVACNALHPLEARCCRWLLATHDRVGRDDIQLTQETLAEMLGVQRTTVTGIARILRDKGLIRYGRGQITIVDRPGLEAAACECHAAVTTHFERILPEMGAQRLIGRVV
ncbi:MAG TPA: Crp/Fnr family transcriptional regulator [Alphaproteobacteria bacterium]|nr:Crp/Fnr family transcriptional regulator [Alphaproteobacteria bacterium]